MSWLPLRRAQLGTIVLGAATSVAIWLISRPWNTRGWLMGAPFGRDFVNFWMAPRLVLAGRGDALVDLPAYAEAIKQAFALSREPGLLFVYPPHILPFLVPFALLPFLPAVLAWTGLNLAALAWATRLIRPRPGRALVLLACASPPALVMVLYGHFGGLLALAATVAVLQGDRRPWLSGLCLAFLTVKPQYAAALGLILLCGGRWRCLIVAGAATAALVAVSAAAFGPDLWRNFVTVTMPMQSAIVSDFQPKLIESAVSAYFAARLWGVPAAAAWAIQGTVTAGALAAGVAALRRRGPDAPTLLVVLLSALVMQPYVSHYDLAIVAPALTLVLMAPGARFLPLPSLVWVLMPLARVLFLLDFPILGVLVPASLFAQALRGGAAARSSRREIGEGRLNPAA